jgi:hypothetical protein
MKQNTLWSQLRWYVAIKLMRAAMAVAPSGTAKIRLAELTRTWCRECLTAWTARYPTTGAPR